MESILLSIAYLPPGSLVWPRSQSVRARAERKHGISSAEERKEKRLPVR